MAHATGNPAHVPVRIVADRSGLSEKEQAALCLLIEAAKIMDEAYLKQMRANSPAIEGTFTKPALPFFYPRNATKEEIKAFISEHPESSEELLSPFTEIVRSGDGLTAIPYNEMYQTAFVRIADLLIRAADLVEAPLTREFLQKRAEAFLTNEYRESDIAWIHANDSPFELTIGAFESYRDTLFGVKRTFEAVLGIIRPDETREAGMFQEQIQRFDVMLGARYEYASTPTLTPMVVIDEVMAAGDSWYEYVPMAYNLPNDEDIHKEVGSKKVFIKNVMDAKMSLITKPIVDRILLPAFTFDSHAALLFVTGHEASHGISFRFDGEQFGPIHSNLEECKADVFGILFLLFLANDGKLDREVLTVAARAHIADCIRQARFGAGEAHAVGALVQLNWLAGRGAITIRNGSIWIERSLLWDGFQSLGDALYALSCTNSEHAATKFSGTWGGMPEGLGTIIESLVDLPTDIDPQFDV